MEDFNEQFRGYLQQDSQELLGSLLDGLHEDLNTVVNKPYIESSDSSDQSDSEIAAKSWRYHKSRDDSFIVDLFQGQYKSRLVCDVCKKKSVTFDTFMYLSLPLPSSVEVNLVYIPYKTSHQRLSIQFNTSEPTIKDVKQEIIDRQHPQEPSLVVVKIENGKITKILDDEETVEGPIYVYELPSYSNKVVFPVYSDLEYPFLLVTDENNDVQAVLDQNFGKFVDAVRVFDSDQVSMYPFEFPIVDETSEFHWIDGNNSVKQGQGVVVEGIVSAAMKKTVKTKAKLRNITLEDCLDEYTQMEHLNEQDAWYCPRCKQLQCASKKIDIWKLPEIMVIHLKRFKGRNKMDTFIDFPLTDLSMQGHHQKVIYDLYAVDNHYGRGIHGGHYTAFAKNIETSEWFEFDDTRVSKIIPNEVKVKK